MSKCDYCKKEESLTWDDILSHGADLIAKQIDKDVLNEIHILAMKQNAMLGIHVYE